MRSNKNRPSSCSGLVGMMLTLLICLSFNCSSCLGCSTQCRSFNNPTYSTITPSEYPVLSFPGSTPGSDLLARQIQMKDEASSVSGVMSSLTQFTLAFVPGSTLLTGLYDSMKSVSDSLCTLQDLRDRLVDIKIRDAITQSSITGLQAKFVTLRIPVRKMMYDKISMEKKKTVIASTQATIVEIYELLRNEKGDFWTDNLVSAPYLLDFAMLFGPVAKVSSLLDPDQRQDYRKLAWGLASLIRKYRDDVIPKRLALLEEKEGSFQNCQQLYYRDCSSGYEGLISGTRIRQTGATTCSKDFSTDSSPFYETNIKITSKPYHYTVEDPVTNFKVCGRENDCLGDYKNVLRSHLEKAFKVAEDFVKNSMQIGY